jgi:general stress protein YciG
MAEKKGRSEEEKGEMSVREAGHKGGETTAKTHGHEFYEEIGHKGGEKGGQKGGQKVKELIEKGKEADERKK